MVFSAMEVLVRVFKLRGYTPAMVLHFCTEHGFITSQFTGVSNQTMGVR